MGDYLILRKSLIIKPLISRGDLRADGRYRDWSQVMSGVTQILLFQPQATARAPGHSLSLVNICCPRHNKTICPTGDLSITIITLATSGSDLSPSTFYCHIAALMTKCRRGHNKDIFYFMKHAYFAHFVTEEPSIFK